MSATLNPKFRRESRPQFLRRVVQEARERQVAATLGLIGTIETQDDLDRAAARLTLHRGGRRQRPDALIHDRPDEGPPVCGVPRAGLSATRAHPNKTQHSRVCGGRNDRA